MFEKSMTTSSQIQKQVRGTLYSITSCLESFSSASSGARMASIGGISSSFWAACTLRSVASAANWAASAAFLSSFVFLSSKFWKMSVYQRAINRGAQTTKGIHRIYTLASRRDSVNLSFSSTFSSSAVSCHHNTNILLAISTDKEALLTK